MSQEIYFIAQLFLVVIGFLMYQVILKYSNILNIFCCFGLIMVKLLFNFDSRD